MKKIIDALRHHSVAIVVVVMGTINLINTLRSCLPPAWVAVADGVLPILTIVLHYAQVLEATNATPPTNPQ